MKLKSALIGERLLSHHRRGYALPVVLLILSVMSILALRLVETSRTEATIARVYLDELIAREAADAGYAMFVARSSAASGQGIPEPLQAKIGNARVNVKAEPESGKIDLNTGSLEILGALLLSVGADAQRVETIIGEFEGLRSSGDENLMREVDALLQFEQMDLTLLEQVRPYVTVYNGTPGIDFRWAPIPVLMAVPGMTGEIADSIAEAVETDSELSADAHRAVRGYGSRGRTIYTIRSSATLEDKVTFIREAVVDLGDPAEPLVLAWRRAYSGGANPRGSNE